MRLALCFLLVVLAVCCYEANAKVCNAVKRESSIFLLGSKELLKMDLQRYGAPPEAVEAKLKVKECVDKNLTMIEKLAVSAVVQPLSPAVLIAAVIERQAPRQESASESMILATIPKDVYGTPK
ncbi:secretoglobin family 1D member 1-like [Onychomys torridus]|uniref:secretoglobin family 1D member 1-like n=1 Tax=Onychomys torridus TaxID=38674 RepID=UPI00167FCDFC|nr:secretoglobin family 1D member 1-like [Onychomys torridus]